MSSAEMVRAILEDEHVQSPRIVDGAFAIKSRLVDRRELIEELAAWNDACGWVTTTGTVSRIGPGEAARLADGERILSADLHRSGDDATAIIRSEGNQWRFRTVHSSAGEGLLVTRRWIALDGGYLRYQTAWNLDDGGALSAGVTRFVGFDETGDLA